MNYLDLNQVLAIHGEAIAQTGGPGEIRDIGLVDSAAARPQATFDGKDLYPDIFSKAACLGHSLIRNHPFVDGNKRTGYLSMRLFLNINGYDIKAGEDEKYKFVIEIAEKVSDEQSIAQWLKKHSRKIR